jgi:hypothetical protein
MPSAAGAMAVAMAAIGSSSGNRKVYGRDISWTRDQLKVTPKRADISAWATGRW